MKLSIIIPTKDNPACLKKLLESIQQATPTETKPEILVMDDGSETDLAPLCSEYGAEWSRIDKSLGPAHNRNRAADIATGDTLVFLDDDVILPPEFFEAIAEVMDRDPHVGAVSFINQPYHPDDSAVANFGAAIEHYWFTKSFDAQHPNSAEVRGFTTRNGAVRKVAYLDIGGFDTTFKTNAHEDYDFGKRLAAQVSTVLLRQPNVYHRFPPKLSRLMRNYWVRTTLFVPYMLQHKPTLDDSQASPGEARLRLMGSGALAMTALGLLPIPGRILALALGGIGLFAYFLSIMKFLKAAKTWSQSYSFVLQAALIHLSSSVVISCAAAWGLVRFLLHRQRHELKSPLDTSQ